VNAIFIKHLNLEIGYDQLLVTEIDVIIFRITTQVIKNINGQSVLEFYVKEHISDREQNSFWLEAHHDFSSTYLSNKTTSINQTLRSTTTFLIGSIYYEPLTNDATNQEVTIESIGKHILNLENISLLSSLSQNCSNTQSITLP